MEVELTSIGEGWVWVVRRGRTQGCLPAFWPEQLGGRWCRFLRWGDTGRGRLGRKSRVYFWTFYTGAVICLAWLIADRAPRASGLQEGRKEAGGSGPEVALAMCASTRCFEVSKLFQYPLPCLRSSGGRGAFPVPSRGRADLLQPLHSAAKKDHGLVYRLSGEVLHICWDRSLIHCELQDPGLSLLCPPCPALACTSWILSAGFS